MLTLPIRTIPIVRSAVGENAEKATALRSLKKSAPAHYLIAGRQGDGLSCSFSPTAEIAPGWKAVLLAGDVKQLLL